MPGAMPAELAERLSDVSQRDIEAWIPQAREELADKMLSGGKVGGCILRDLLDTDLDENYARAISEFEACLLNEDCPSSQKRYAQNLVEMFLDAHPDFAEELAAEYADEGDWCHENE